jgi:hypothetical protein
MVSPMPLQNNPDYRPRFKAALLAEKQRVNEGLTVLRSLTQDEYLDVCQTLAEAIFNEGKADGAKVKRQQKKADIAEGAEQIYDAYPKHVGREDALKAITKALKAHPIEYLLDKTNQFRMAVESWPSSYRYFPDGGDRCPHPSTWFNRGSYADAVKEWRRAGARHGPGRPTTSIPHANEAEQALESQRMRERYLSMPEPEKGTLEHSLWLEAKTTAAIESITDGATAPILQLEAETRLRHA